MNMNTTNNNFIFVNFNNNNNNYSIDNPNNMSNTDFLTKDHSLLTR